MGKKGKDFEEGGPEPLNFDEEDGQKLEGSELSDEDIRGDDQGYQHYEEEESISPEELKKREEEGNL